MDLGLQIIYLGNGRALDPEVLQWVTDEDNRPLLRNLPLELKEDLKVAFLVLPRGIDDDSGFPPEPVVSLLGMIENHAVLPVVYRNQLAWLIAIHE